MPITHESELLNVGKGRIMIRFIVAMALGALALGPALAQSPAVIKFSHVVAPDTPKGKGAEKFKELGERYTDGRVKIEVYANSSLYKDKEEVEALQLGAVQMLAPSLAKFGPLGAREFEVFDLPYILPTKEALRKITDGPIGKKLFAKLEPKGITGLAYWDNGFKIMSANRPLHMPADFRGLKMRIQSSKVLEAQIRALGAIPQVMAFSDVYQALQTGVVDGQDNVTSNIWTQKYYEVQKHLTVSYHGRLTYALVTNNKFWGSLPAEVRGGLDRAVKESTDYFNSVAETDNADALEKIKASGKIQVHVLTDTEKKAWVAKLMPVHKEMQSRFGKDFIDKIYKASGFIAPQS